MKQDYRSPALQSLGVRTWRGAAMFGLQVFAILLPVLVGVKLVGVMLDIAPIADKSWWLVLLSPVGTGFGMFIFVALIAELQKLADL